jgi:hypothetical protein
MWVLRRPELPRGARYLSPTPVPNLSSLWAATDGCGTLTLTPSALAGFASRCNYPPRHRTLADDDQGNCRTSTVAPTVVCRRVLVMLGELLSNLGSRQTFGHQDALLCISAARPPGRSIGGAGLDCKRVDLWSLACVRSRDQPFDCDPILLSDLA